MKLQIYCANLHVGGAVGVAATFLDQLPLIRQTALAWASEIEVIASSEVLRNLASTSALRSTQDVHLRRRDDYPRKAPFLRGKRPFDIQFVVFGPDYSFSGPGLKVAGFADGSILPVHPVAQPATKKTSLSPAALGRLLLNRSKLRLLTTYDLVVVQTEAMKASVMNLDPRMNVRVVPNIPSPVLFDPSRWHETVLPLRSAGEYRFFYPARGYPHKNHTWLGPFAEEVSRISGRECRIVVTLKADEMRRLGLQGNRVFINVGAVTLNQLPPLYLATDGLIMPSLNETSSASPLEALTMNRPVFLLDTPLMRMLAEDRAIFLSDKCFADAARTAIEAIEEIHRYPNADLPARVWLESLPTAPEQAAMYVHILHDVLKTSGIG